MSNSLPRIVTILPEVPPGRRATDARELMAHHNGDETRHAGNVHDFRLCHDYAIVSQYTN
jgi:hypothetical protein